MKIRLMSLDPGLGTFGLTVVDTDGVDRKCVHADVFTSEPLWRKMKIDKSDDDVRRTTLLSRWIETKFARWQPGIVAAEAMSFPRNHQAVVCISLAWGVLTCQIDMRGLVLITAGPMEWRRELVNNGKEARAQAYAIRQCPTFKIAAGGIARRDEVHARDALGVSIWAERTDTVRAMIEGT